MFNYLEKITEFENNTNNVLLTENKIYDWKTYIQNIKRFGSKLCSLGVSNDECVSIMGFNHPSWFMSAVGANIVNVPFSGIYPTNGSEEVHHNLETSNTSVLVIENNKLLHQIKLKRNLKAIVVYNDDITQFLLNNEDGINYYINDDLRIPIYTFNSFINVEEDKNFDLIREKKDVSCYIFTSGTTSKSKAVSITYENIGYTGEKMCKEYGMSDEVIVSYLPLSHIAALMLDVFLLFYHGGSVCFAKPDALKGSLVDSLKKYKPTIFFGVPRVYEKMMEKMKAIAERKYSGTIGGWLKSIINYGKNNVLEYHLNNQNNVFNSSKISNIRSIYNKFVFNKIKNNLGFERTNYFFTGAAPITMQVLHYFGSIDIPILELYGMSETTGVITASTNDNYKWGSVGRAIIGIVKIAEDGEILYNGNNNFKEYKNNNDATNEIYDNSWLHTGDLGKVENDYLYIIGRKKELLITAGGENVAPVLIENRIKELIPLINQIVIIGDKQKYLTALVTLTKEPNSNVLDTSIKNIDNNVKTIDDALKSDKINEYIENGIKEYNLKPISNAQKIQKFKLLNDDFSIENGTMTPTMKLKRAVIVNKYENEINSLYQ